MGNVRSGDFDMDISGKFAELNIYTREDCPELLGPLLLQRRLLRLQPLVNGDIKKPKR